MLLVVLFAAGFVVALVVGALVRGSRARLLLVAGGVVLWAAYAVYAEELASCPERGECDKGLGVVFLGAVVAGWVAGIAASRLFTRTTRS